MSTRMAWRIAPRLAGPVRLPTVWAAKMTAPSCPTPGGGTSRTPSHDPSGNDEEHEDAGFAGSPVRVDLRGLRAAGPFPPRRMHRARRKRGAFHPFERPGAAPLARARARLGDPRRGNDGPAGRQSHELAARIE